MCAARISVVVPAYNAETYLREALCSILKQTLVPDEIIVVNDGSSDKTTQIADNFDDVRLLDMPHAGAAAARNMGVTHTSGRYLAFLDADDLWAPTKIERQLEHLHQNPDTQGVFTLLRQFVSSELPDSEKSRYKLGEKPVPALVAGSLLIDRAAFLDVGLFDETLLTGEFIEWMLRARQNGIKFSTIDETLMFRRIHGKNSVLRNQSLLGKDYLRIVRQNLKNQNDDN